MADRLVNIVLIAVILSQAAGAYFARESSRAWVEMSQNRRAVDAAVIKATEQNTMIARACLAVAQGHKLD